MSKSKIILVSITPYASAQMTMVQYRNLRKLVDLFGNSAVLEAFFTDCEESYGRLFETDMFKKYADSLEKMRYYESTRREIDAINNRIYN